MEKKFCPKCRSQEIEDITETAHGKIGYFSYASSRLYQYSKCEFTNAFFPEADKKILGQLKRN